MKYKKVFNRRTMLRGAGTVAIGLPFVDAMRTTSAWAAAPEPQARAFNVFFGLGFPTPLQSEGFTGPMEPLGELADKLLVVRGIDQVRCDVPGINAHYDGSSGAFTAEPPDGSARSHGPSIDQVIRRELYPNGLPPEVLSTVLMGTFFRRGRPSRYLHSWNYDGTPADIPLEEPRALFDRVFGIDPLMNDDDPEMQRQQRLRRSVLDSVMEQYRHFTSEAAGLGAESRAKIRDHLDRVREHEVRAYSHRPIACNIPNRPGASPIPHGDAADPDGDGIDIILADLVNEWRLMSDLYALGIQCDVIRIGGVTFQSAGERIRLTGRYEYNGQLVYDFNDRRDRGTGGSLGCSHEYWHRFDESRANTELRAHLHLMMREVTYFLKLLADPEHADENGLSILENSTVTISTESGDGRHNDVVRELSGVFHAISGANERFRSGSIINVNAEGLDLYNTMLEAHGIARRLGPDGRSLNRLSAILR